MIFQYHNGAFGQSHIRFLNLIFLQQRSVGTSVAAPSDTSNIAQGIGHGMASEIAYKITSSRRGR